MSALQATENLVSPPLDSAWVRAQFPALRSDWAFFDNAGGSAPCRAAIDAVRAHMEALPFQLGASYPGSVRAGEAVDAGRADAARLFGAEADEIVFGASSTALVRLLARALRPRWTAGDEVVVTNLDHEANIGPWRALEETGIVLREWRLRPASATLELADLEPLLSERTRLVAFTHCSNVVGTVLDVAAITARVRAAGALSCVDGVAFAPHRRVDVRALGADFYFASVYKVFGPHLGVLYGRRERWDEAAPQSWFFSTAGGPSRFEPGNPCYELAASLSGVVGYLEELDRHHGGPGSIAGAFERIAAHERVLAAPLLAFLDAHPRTRVLGPEDAERLPTVAFAVEGEPASAIPPRLDRERIATRFGHFYAYRAIRDLGLLERDGVVRASMAHYNTPGEVTRLVDALDVALGEGEATRTSVAVDTKARS